jgi:hypothetical protein
MIATDWDLKVSMGQYWISSAVAKELMASK